MNDFFQRQEHNRKGKRQIPLRAGITIYFTLMLVLILALICTLIESGRVSAIRTAARSKVFMAADSAFSEFAQPVFDRYGVMFLWTDEEGFRETFDDYMKKTISLKDTGAGTDMDLYGIRYLGSEMKGVMRITDRAAKPFADQVYEYMKVHAMEGVAETLLSQSDLFRQSEKTREVLGTITSYEQSFAKVEEGAVKIYETTERIRDLSENPKSLLDEMEQLFSEPQEGSARKQFHAGKKKWVQTEKKLQKEVTGLEKETEAYYRDVSETKETVVRMQEEIGLDEDDLDPEVYKALHGRLQHFEDLGTEESVQNQSIAENAKKARALEDSMKNMNEYFAETEAALEAEDYETCRRLTAQYKEKLEVPSFTEIKTGSGERITEKASAGFIGKISKEYKKGILDLFADEISAKQIETKDLPSHTCSQKTEETEETEEMSFADQTVQKAFFCEYIREHFNCYTEKKRETVLDYEAEYILGGKDNDRDNLTSVVTKLMFLRIGMNIMCLMLDGKKMAEIEELALAIAGASTQVYIAEIVKSLILIAWATAEAMLDVRVLLKGKKVALIKKDEDWNFSLQGLQNYTGDEKTEKESKTGLSYREYLLMLLMTQGKTKQVFRTMDLIQMNMCEEETETFRIKDCLVGVQTEATFSAPAVFASLPVVRHLFTAGREGYRFTFLQDYAY